LSVMHELAIAQSIVEACVERSGGGKVDRVTVEVGSLAAVMSDSLLFCFDVCAQGTPLEGARLEIVEIPGQGRCRRCGRELVMKDYLATCDCGSIDIQCVAGGGLRLKQMEVS
jgi:hydrogenase nickel incorporation protein HypA/HybF